MISDEGTFIEYPASELEVIKKRKPAPKEKPQKPREAKKPQGHAKKQHRPKTPRPNKPERDA